MRFLSVCSGIEAASVAWGPLGWKAVAFSEIEPFPCAVLSHHYPDVPNLGDMTKYKDWPNYAIDILCGGTPCQSFSVAGLRKGLDDPRGNLMLTFGAIAAKYRPKWLVWENVPGVLSSNGGGDFGAFLGMLGQLGYGFAYRVLDAQYFGVAQRRRRVFVVGCLGDWRSAAAVLFERHSLQGHPAPSRESREGVAGGIEIGPGGGRFTDLNPTLDTRANYSNPRPGYPCHPLAAGAHAPTIAFPAKLSATQHASTENLSPALGALNPTAVAFGGDIARTLQARHDSSPCADRGMDVVATSMQVRRLVPEECERLQGFPRSYTAIPWRGKPADQCPDGPRYKALGNSWAIPNVYWIGTRIDAVARINKAQAATECVAETEVV